MENFQYRDCKKVVETDDEALSLADMPVTDKLKKKKSIMTQWGWVMNACKRFLKSSKKESFEFSPSDSFSDHGGSADELFHEGRLLPLTESLSSKSLMHSKSSFNGTSCSSNLGSIIRLENEMTSQVIAVAAHKHMAASASSSSSSPRRILSRSSSLKRQHFKRGLLSIPHSSSSPFSIDKLRKSQRSYSFSSSPSFSWQFTDRRMCGERRGSWQEPKKRNDWKIMLWIGSGCRDYDGSGSNESSVMARRMSGLCLQKKM